MTVNRLAILSATLCALLCGAGCQPARAQEAPAKQADLPTVWIAELGAYGVLEPTWLGSRHYDLGFKPIIDIRREGSREWFSSPNDAAAYSLYETNNFRAGPAANVTLQSRLHGQDIDLRLGQADATLQAGGFAEYYPLDFIRTRAEVLQGIAGDGGLLVNLSADYIWRLEPNVTLSLGPRAQIVNDQYASQYFSTQLAIKNNNNYVPYRAEGGLLTSGAEFTGKYDWTKQLSTKLFLDYTQLMGDAADSPRVNLRGSQEQVIFGVGASYKFSIER
jgi:outer membrane protein